MERRKTRFFVVGALGAIVSFLVGCATPYQPQSFRGGYTDTRISSDTVLVTFKGNGYTPKERTQLYLLYRSAEVTLQDGYNYFIIVNGDTEARTGYIQSYSSNTSASAYASGNSAFGSAQTFGSGSTIPIRKYGTQAMIKMFKGQKPANDPNAYDARETLEFLRPQLGLPNG